MSKQEQINELAEKFESQDKGLSYHELAELAFNYFQAHDMEIIEFSEWTSKAGYIPAMTFRDEWYHKDQGNLPFEEVNYFTTSELLIKFRESKIYSHE
jgi:hypothetical protein